MRFVYLTRDDPATNNGSLKTAVNLDLVTEVTGCEGGGAALFFISGDSCSPRAFIVVQESPEDVLRLAVYGNHVDPAP